MNSPQRLFKMFDRLFNQNWIRSYSEEAGSFKKRSLAIGAKVKPKLPVENDAKKLCSHVCGSNLLLEGEDVKIKPDSEYPDWLWDIQIGPAKTLKEMDTNTKEYWMKVKRIGYKQEKYLKSLEKRHRTQK